MNRLTLFIVLLYPAILKGQEVGLRASAEKEELRLAEPIRVVIEARSTLDLDSIGPFPVDSAGMFDVLSIARGENERQWVVELMTLDTGRVFLSPLKFGYVVKGDTSVRTAYANSLAFTVRSVEVGEGADIRDIKPPMYAPWRWEDLWPYGAVLLLMGAGYYGYRRWSAKRETGGVEISPEPDVAPHVRALRELRELEERKLWQQGRVKDYYSECTEIVRRFYEGRWDVRALEMTSDEIHDALNTRGVAPDLLVKNRTLLAIADLVKFAKTQPTPADHQEELETAFTLVRGMTPAAKTVEEEQTEEAAVAG